MQPEIELCMFEYPQEMGLVWKLLTVNEKSASKPLKIVIAIEFKYVGHFHEYR